MENTELVFNLWYYVDAESQLVYALAGRAYYLEGGDEEKVEILRGLSKSDFILSDRHPIPERHWVTVDGGAKIKYTAVDFVHMLQFQLFEDLAEKLVSQMPLIPSIVDGELISREHEIPKSPLCLYTALVEEEVGNIQVMAQKPPESGTSF